MKVRATNARASSVVMLTVPKWFSTLLVVVSLAGIVPGVFAADHEFAPASEETYVQSVRPFFEKHCFKCHDEQTANAGLRVDVLGTQFVSAPAEEWVEVMDAINSGEMPPEDEPRPDAAKSFEVVKWIAAQLTHAEKAAREAGGQIPMRRLNRDEFANTVRDLLQLDEKLLAPIVEDLPGDGKAEGFDRLGVALFFDQTQLERTLAVAEQIAELAIVNPDEKPEMKTTRFEAEVERSSRDGSVLGMGIRHPDELERHRYDPDQRIPGGPRGYEVTEDGVIFVKGGGFFSRNDQRGRIAQIPVDDLIPEDGYYRVRLRGGGDMGTRGEPLTLSIIYNHKTPQEQNWDIPFTPSLDEPDVVEATMFIPRGEPDQTRRITLAYNHLHDYIVDTPTNRQLYVDTVHTALKIPKARQAGDETEVARLEAFLKDANARAKAWKGPLREINPKHAGIEPPRVFVDWVEFEGPVKGEWPPRSHQSLLFDGDKRGDLAYAREVIERFLPRAYRRPAKPGEVDRVVELIGAEMSAGKDFHSALRVGLARILASPGFLFLSEPSAKGSRPLNDYELANRLSYFLWSTMPDAELFKLAAAGELSRPGILAAQVSRMLADPKSREFVENFAGQWLQVREFGSVMPATDLYRDYDKSLEESSRLEAYAFFEEILQKNLPITNFLDSDFVMINERLARHYEIEGVEGDELRRVSLTPDHHRGGVFGMAGLMTLLADGTRTLPVRRAAWIVENLFNDPSPPPPPNAGEVQPNTEGEELTVRERLELHRNETTCASCHAVLDPYGLALENYDAVGKWRTRQNGENFRGNNAPQLVIEGELPTGQRFSSLEGFKAALLEEKDDFARAFSERMLTYALGRPVGYSDRDMIESLVNALQENDYRIQVLVQAIVKSEPFLTK